MSLAVCSLCCAPCDAACYCPGCDAVICYTCDQVAGLSTRPHALYEHKCPPRRLDDDDDNRFRDTRGPRYGADVSTRRPLRSHFNG